jgi:hypothetical protein
MASGSTATVVPWRHDVPRDNRGREVHVGDVVKFAPEGYGPESFAKTYGVVTRISVDKDDLFESEFSGTAHVDVDASDERGRIAKPRAGYELNNFYVVSSAHKPPRRGMPKKREPPFVTTRIDRSNFRRE